VASCSFATARDRDALWKIMHDQCVPDEQANHNPAPCVRVDLKGGLDKGYVILKDRVGLAQFLLIPTRKLAGIESPEILLPSWPNYWADAWQNRTYVSAVAWDKIGVAINAEPERSQDQLHIHIDCLRPDVRAALAAHMGEIGATWAELSFDLHGERFRAAARRRGSCNSGPVQTSGEQLAGGSNGHAR
jgi:CDP-diacylglycerol pyrophosphatase